MKTSLILIALMATLAGTASANVVDTPSCKGSQLSGRFAVVPGSAGAGNITYALRLKNVSTSTCVVTGLPQGRLLGRHGGKLPTRVQAAFAPGLTAILVTLQPGQSTRATARFTPDVPGPGEQATKQCEPTAYSFRVTGQGGGTTTVRMLPPTPVCVHGRLLFSAYGLG